MYVFKKAIMLTIAACLFSSVIHAESVKAIFPDSHSLTWSVMPSHPEIKYAVLAGDPAKAEFYIIRLKLPANYQDAPHQHFYDKYDTVVSGTYYLGIGSKFNKDNAIGLPAGSFFKVSAKVDHYGFTKEETILQISGVGPWSGIAQKS